MRSLLTVSEFALRGGEAERALQRWTAETASFNAGLGLTGGLILARNLMADIVEGDPAAIDLSLQRAREAHHQIHVTVVDSLTVAARSFAGWRLLYEGWSTYVATPIAALLDEPDAFNSSRLRSLMAAFADVKTRPAGAAEVRRIGERWSREGKESSLT